MSEKWVKHGIAVSVIALFVVLALGSGTTPPQPIVEGRIEGQVKQVVPIEKDFEFLDVFFITTTATFDSSGNLINGSYVTYELLMKEVQKLGGDDFTNLRIDRKIDPKAKVNTYTASALAIKYKENQHE
jgi:hypothetical protein